MIIQWGWFKFPSGLGYTDVTLGISYSNSSYFVITGQKFLATTDTMAHQCWMGGIPIADNKIRIGNRSASGSYDAADIYFLTIGY